MAFVSRLLRLTITTHLLLGGPSLAQGLADPDSIDTIVGSEVTEDESTSDRAYLRVMDLIENTRESVRTVRKVWKLDSLDIVYLPEASMLEGGPPDDVAKKLEENAADVTELRGEIEGNAMLYHAINSRGILARDILAIDFIDRQNARVYVAARP